MKPPLLLNHSFLEGLAYRAVEGDKEARKAARQPVVDVAETVQRARLREGAILYVHPEFGSAEVSPGQSFIHWANQHQRDAAWGTTLSLLLQLLSGPFVTSLPVDDGQCPGDTEPSCLNAPAWLVEMMLTAAHHGLAFGPSSLILSYGPKPHLDAPSYVARRDEGAIELRNLRTNKEARDAEAAQSLEGAQTTISVLEAAVGCTDRVRVLDTARSSAKRWELDCRPDDLLAAIRGLDAYALALDAGLPRESAAERYRLACRVEMSQEKAQTLKKPVLRAQRMFMIPGDKERQLFDMHAKPGPKTRVHVFARDEGGAASDDGDDGGDASDDKRKRRTLVYIGYCGEHLDLK